MKRIILFCVYGTSSEILAKNMRKFADDEGFECVIEAYPSTEIFKRSKNADVILLCPQIRFSKYRVSEQFPNIPVDSIDIKIFGNKDGKSTLDLAKKLMNV